MEKKQPTAKSRSYVHATCAIVLPAIPPCQAGCRDILLAVVSMTPKARTLPQLAVYEPVQLRVPGRLSVARSIDMTSHSGIVDDCGNPATRKSVHARLGHLKVRFLFIEVPIKNRRMSIPLMSFD